jgi:hypothetical protein
MLFPRIVRPLCGGALVLAALNFGGVSQALAQCNDVTGWNQYGFALGVNRSASLSDLVFTWCVRSPYHYDAFNVRVCYNSCGGEGQVEVRGGTGGSYRVRNAPVGANYMFKVQGCDKRTFGPSKCTGWSQYPFKNVL